MLKIFCRFSDPVVLIEKLPALTSSTTNLKEFYEKQKDGVRASELAKIGNKNIHYNNPHTCYVCKNVFATRRVLTQHLQKIHRKAPTMFCDQCPKKYTSKASLTFHMVIHCKSKNFTCHVCGFKTYFRQYLLRHMVKHNTKVKCEICSKEVADLREHMRTHRPKQECPICHKIVSCHHLNRHIGTHKGGLLKCKDCGEKFVTISDLKK